MAAAAIELLGELHAEGVTIVLVTHDPTVAAYADWLITVRDGCLVGDTLSTGIMAQQEQRRELVLR